MFVSHLAAAAEVGAYTFTTARFWATAAALLALAATVLAALARARAARGRGEGGRRAAVVALVAGLGAAAGGAVTLLVADGGPGTGNGVVAGGAAVVLGLAAVVLGGRVLARSRRADAPALAGNGR
ncbi:DUF6223 family protein [Georgenia daeguensis]|uniref:Uncharacterized protein n=1 Tax=Georgenia daeguensis TaxID=908355 RepID=A0ABP8EWF0_9MICO